MSTQIYICPRCGCPDLEAEKSSIIVPAKERVVSCPNCKWEGTLAETTGILTSEEVFDSKAVANFLLYVVAKHAAGPLAQAFVYIGLLEAGDQEGTDKVMRAAFEGLIREALTAAAVHSAQKGTPNEPS